MSFFPQTTKLPVILQSQIDGAAKNIKFSIFILQCFSIERHLLLQHHKQALQLCLHKVRLWSRLEQMLFGQNSRPPSERVDRRLSRMNWKLKKLEEKIKTRKKFPGRNFGQKKIGSILNETCWDQMTGLRKWKHWNVLEHFKVLLPWSRRFSKVR